MGGGTRGGGAECKNHESQLRLGPLSRVGERGAMPRIQVVDQSLDTQGHGISPATINYTCSFLENTRFS